MLPKPFKTFNERLDTVTADVQNVSNQLVTAIKIGTVAFVLISIVAVTALLVTVGSANK
jgi:hypothetical protein